MSESKMTDPNLQNIASQFNDAKLQQFPLKLPRLNNPAKPKQSLTHKLKKFSVILPKVKDSNFDNSNSLDGSDVDQSENYINSEDNMKEQIDQMKKKMNLSKYSEKFPHPESSQQKLREKHSGSSTYIKNNKILQDEREEQIRTPLKEEEKSKRLQRRQNKSVSSPQNDSDSDFQQKVEANRAFIKNKMFMKKNKEDKNKLINKKPVLFDNPPTSNQQLLYQKRVKDYKNQSQNKYLNDKKKQINDIALLNVKIKKIENFLKPREKNYSAKQMTEDKERKVSSSINNEAFTKNVSAQKSKNKRRKSKLKQKMLDQSPNSYPVSENLFADINIILGKKQKSRSQFLSVGKESSLSIHNNMKIKKKISLNIKQLEQSFRILEEQESKLLGYKRQPQNIKIAINKSLILPSNLIEWQRVEISENRRNLNLIESNFVNEVDRINNFHQKNEQCLETYITNRQFLIQLQIQEKLRQMSAMRNKLDISNNQEDKQTNR